MLLDGFEEFDELLATAEVLEGLAACDLLFQLTERVLDPLNARNLLDLLNSRAEYLMHSGARPWNCPAEPCLCARHDASYPVKSRLNRISNLLIELRDAAGHRDLQACGRRRR